MSERTPRPTPSGTTAIVDVVALRQQYAEIDARLDAAASSLPAERDKVKAEIIGLFRTVEAAIADLSALKDDIKKLVDKYKSMQQPSLAPQFTAERPAVHADHIGASTFIEKGWSRISLGDYVGAEDALTKALKLAPNDVQAESLLGWAMMLQEKYDDALMNFQKVLMREPSNGLARINVGYICLKKRIFGEAIEHLSKAIRLDNDPKAKLYAHFYLGLVYLEREMFEDAQNFFEKTLTLGPNLIEAYYELGRALWFAGDHAQALETWRMGHETNKFNPWGKRCAELKKLVESGGEPPRVGSAEA
jgi:tetratricopeptide (TPR) repeat protein